MSRRVCNLIDEALFYMIIRSSGKTYIQSMSQTNSKHSNSIIEFKEFNTWKISTKQPLLIERAYISLENWR